MLRKLCLLLVSTILCTATPATAGNQQPKPLVRTIAVVPATSPTSYSLSNMSMAPVLFPITGVAHIVDSKAKAKNFNEKFLATSPKLGEAISTPLAEHLRSLGYEITVLDSLERQADDPDDIDYEAIWQLANADAVLHVYFSEVGLRSPPSSLSYLPRVNARGIVFRKGHRNYLYEQEIYYGVDAREGKNWAIPSNERFAFRDIDEVMSNLGGVHEAFRDGAKEIAIRMAKQIHDALK